MEQNTYGRLLDGGEHTSGLNHILGTSLTPFNVSRVPPGNETGQSGEDHGWGGGHRLNHNHIDKRKPNFMQDLIDSSEGVI